MRTRSTVKNTEVIHDVGAHQFIMLNGRDKCTLDYVLNTSKQTMDIHHTFVPPKHRGKGFATLLCDAAYQYAGEHKLEINPICTYVQEVYAKRIVK